MNYSRPRHEYTRLGPKFSCEDVIFKLSILVSQLNIPLGHSFQRTGTVLAKSILIDYSVRNPTIIYSEK